MCFYEISVHSVMTHQMSLLARVLYKRNPATTCGDFFSTTSPIQRRSTLILKESIFFVNIIFFLLYSQLFQISQIFENVFRKLPDCVVLQPSDEKNNTAVIGKCFHIF